ncbi:MAG TPA: haloalkane dehalogenase, partial [Acidimicrobiia bacterium]
EAGRGDPIVFPHGNPTSSFLWRNIIPHMEAMGRCVAPDLIGMGDSAKLPAGAPYDFEQHREFLDAFIHGVGIEDDVVLVVHDWGSALGFDWSNRHRAAVKGIAYMEALVRPITWDDWPEESRRLFQAMRSDAGETICLEKNVFVERILPGSILRELSPEELQEYLRPYTLPGESRRPTLSWPRQIPIDGEPANVAGIVADYAAWLATAEVPKLYVRADPGFLTGVSDPTCRTWPSQQEVTVKGIHFIQEDAPDEIGRALASWYLGL